MYSDQSPNAFQAFLDFVWSPFQAIKYFYRDLSEIDHRLRDDSIAVRIVTTITMPFRLLGGFLSLMVQNWPTSRSGFAAIAGIPAFFTLVGLLGAWVLVDYVQNDSQRVTTNKQYYKHNVETHPDTPESALAYAQKLVEIDPNDVTLKYQLGLAEARAGNLFAANDAMTSIAPDEPKASENPDDPEKKSGFLDAHIWRARYLVRNKTAEEFKAVIKQAENHLKMAIEADKENLSGKAELASIYMRYANLLEERSPERREYLIKADDTFREIIEDKDTNQTNNSIQITTLRPSVLVRKQLEAIDPDTYSVKSEIQRVRGSVSNFLRLASRYKHQDIRLWLTMMNSVSEIQQYDFATEIADQGLKIVEAPEARAGLTKAKSYTLIKAAININNFDDFESYRDRFIYLCEAIRTAPAEPQSYLLLLQYIGKENPKPTMQFARQIGLAKPGDAVPIKPEWLYRICVDAEYTGIVTSLIGLQEFHSGDNESAIKNWNVAQEFEISTREFIAKILETMLLARQEKLDHLDTILEEALLVYPEAIRMRVLRGIYNTKEEKFQAAIDDFRSVLFTRPDEVALHQRIKSCYILMGLRRFAEDEQKLIDIKLQSMPLEKRLQTQEMLQKMEDAQADAPQ